MAQGQELFAWRTLQHANGEDRVLYDAFQSDLRIATNRDDLVTLFTCSQIVSHRTPDWRRADHLNKHLSLSISNIIAQDETLADSLGARDCQEDKQWKSIPL